MVPPAQPAWLASASACLISVMADLYLGGNNGHVVDAARLFHQSAGERPARRRGAARAAESDNASRSLAAAGVITSRSSSVTALDLLTLALSFGLYGLIRKVVAVERCRPQSTLLPTPLAGAYLPVRVAGTAIGHLGAHRCAADRQRLRRHCRRTVCVRR
jgi:hypothetical protein